MRMSSLIDVYESASRRAAHQLEGYDRAIKILKEK